MNLKRVFSRYNKRRLFQTGSKENINFTGTFYADLSEKNIMKKALYLQLIISCSLALIVFNSCKKNYTEKIVPDQSFVEEFDTVSAAVARGWHLINESSPLGNGTWQDGGESPPFFNAYSNKGNNAGFIGVDYLSTSAEKGTISNWLVSPSLLMQNGDRIIFYTRSYYLFNGTDDSTDYGNGLQVRMNPLNDSLNVGNAFTTGSFTTELLNINPNQNWSSVIIPNVVAYPTQWTRFDVTIAGLKTSVRARFAFRYFVIDGGSNGNGTGIGIDSVAYKSAGH
ncbi:MAG: choice-of-anchor J domain-containing protein [Ginsengibacter sp.]